MSTDGQRPGMARLADVVMRRRARLRLTQEQVARAGGPSDRTQRAIEGGTADEPTARTFAKLDLGLSWSLGTARAVYAGEITANEAVDSESADEKPADGIAPGERPRCNDPAVHAVFDAWQAAPYRDRLEASSLGIFDALDMVRDAVAAVRASDAGRSS